MKGFYRRRGLCFWIGIVLLLYYSIECITGINLGEAILNLWNIMGNNDKQISIIITAIYVIVTWRTLVSANRQNRTNISIGLFDRRVEFLERIKTDKWENILTEAELLFDDRIVEHLKEMNRLKSKIHLVELEFNELSSAYENEGLDLSLSTDEEDPNNNFEITNIYKDNILGETRASRRSDIKNKCEALEKDMIKKKRETINLIEEYIKSSIS